MKKVSNKKLFFALILSFQLISFNSSAEDYEPLPVLSAREILPANLLSSPMHTVQDQVQNDGYMNLYVLNTTYGDFNVRGTYFLIKTIKELEALKFIEENYPSTTVAKDAVGGAAKKIITAPIKATSKVINTVTDSEKLTKTAKSIPGGIANLFSVAANGVSDAAQFVYDAGKDAVSKDPKNEDDGSASKFDQATDFISEKALDYIGYNKSYRELAKLLQVDPYTGNKVLRSELFRISSIKSATNIGTKFVPGLSIPGIGIANQYLGYAEKAAMYDDPKQVDKLNREVLDTFSKKDKQIIKSSNKFMNNKNYSPVMRKVIIENIKYLIKRGVSNSESLLTAASNAQTMETAEFYAQSINKISYLESVSGNNHNKSFKRITDDPIIPGAVTHEGTLIVPLPVDYLVWTEQVSSIINNFRRHTGPVNGVLRSEFLISGEVTNRTKSELSKFNNNILKTGTNFSNDIHN